MKNVFIVSERYENKREILSIKTSFKDATDLVHSLCKDAKGEWECFISTDIIIFSGGEVNLDYIIEKHKVDF